jgi:hypothetical protein
LSHILLAVALSLAAVTSVAVELTPHQAEYKVRISVVSGQLNTELQASDAGYVATHVVKPIGMSRVITRGRMQVSSEFTAASDGVRPVSYHAIDTIRDDPEARITFDWESNQARGTVGEEDVVLQLDGLSHDAVSIQYQLMHDLINDRQNASYVLFDVDKMRVANVRNVGAKSVKTTAGQFDVVGIEHQKEGSSRTTTLWCAPELDYLPVVIEQHRKGKLNFRASLTKYVPL